MKEWSLLLQDGAKIRIIKLCVTFKDFIDEKLTNTKKEICRFLLYELN